jgi:MerR family transcriptional regulator/heat shock protein HspR
MTPTIIARDQVARALSVPVTLLVRYEAAGLVRVVREGDVEGYGPAEIRRTWTIVSCQRDLGINLAGVEAVLKLRDHLAQVHRHVEQLATRLRQALEEEDEAAIHGQP